MQPDGQTGHVSYWTNAASRGSGYASRALLLLRTYARSVGLSVLESHVAADNVVSQRVSLAAGFVADATYVDDAGTVMRRYVAHI